MTELEKTSLLQFLDRKIVKTLSVIDTNNTSCYLVSLYKEVRLSLEYGKPVVEGKGVGSGVSVNGRRPLVEI